jgi:cell shape-determining protein MreC
VIAKPSQSFVNSILLDQGSVEGIHTGQMVVAQNNLGIGTVVQVTEHTATVELFGGPQFSGDVHLLKQSLVVPAQGKGGGNLELEIPREIEITDGDLITFPARPDIIIAVIKSVQFDPRDPFQTVLARAPVNVQTLRFVQVVE